MDLTSFFVFKKIRFLFVSVGNESDTLSYTGGTPAPLCGFIRCCNEQYIKFNVGWG